MIVRAFQPTDEQSFLELVNSAYRGFENLTAERVRELLVPPYFNPESFFIGEEKGVAVGCVGVFHLPAKENLEIRYLAVKKPFSNIPTINRLIESALDYAASERSEAVKALTLTIQPYIDAFRRFGFKPIRRILRIAWQPVGLLEEKVETRNVTVVELSEDDVDKASRVFVEALQPYWDWWVEEKGGKETLLNGVADSMRHNPWLAAKARDRIVGVAGVILRPEKHQASFSGVAVLPSFRMMGIGSMLMSAAINKTRQLGYERLVVHTLAYLDALAPGAVLYIKSGGRIEAEYLHMAKESKK